jgi:hypothetical protein
MFWRNVLSRNRADREWREEMEAHLQILTDSFVEQGMTPEEARHAALKQAGNLIRRREEIYQMNGIRWFVQFQQIYAMPHADCAKIPHSQSLPY